MGDENKIKDTFTMLLSEMSRQKREKEFAELDRRKLAKMSDKDLAAWQAKNPEHSPQFILAQHEWNGRLIAAQVKATRWAAWIAVVGAIAGGIAGAILTWWLVSKQPVQKEHRETPGAATQQHEPEEIKNPKPSP